MKRPLASIALVYAAGLLAAELWPAALLLPLAVILTLLLFAALSYFNRRISSQGARKSHLFRFSDFEFRISGLAGLVFLAGSINLSLRTTPLSPHDLRNLPLEPAQLVTIRGTLTETPLQRVYLHDQIETHRSIATLRLSHLRPDKAAWRPARGKVLVLTAGDLPPDFFAGQSVQIAGVLATPPGPVAPGLFDYAAYLRRKSIYYQLKADAPADWTLLSARRTPPLSDRFLAWAQQTLARGLPVEDQSLHLLWAMTLGWKTALNNEIYQPFMRAGTMHIFAISGLHIALIAGICVAMLRVLQLPRAWCGGIVLLLIWFYTGATGWQPSAIRSTVMMSIIIGGWALARPTDLLNSLAAAALGILVWDPQQLFGASFQLSFFVVLSLALLLPPFEKVRDKWLATDPLLPRELVPRWRRWLETPLRWLTTSVAISLAAWIGSLPLTAWYFHLVSPVTLLANVLVVPLSSAALACNLGSLACGSWFGTATEWFNHSAWFWMELMVRFSQTATLVPKGYWYVAAPPMAAIVLYYALVIGLLNRWLLAPGRRVLLIACPVALAVLFLWQLHGRHTTARVTVLPLQGGFAVHAEHPALGQEILFDCGRSNAVEFITKPFLRALGVDDLPALVLSHGDIRHMGGAELMCEEFSIAHVCVSPVRFRSSVYRRAVEHLSEQSGLLRYLKPNERLGPWTVLYPEADDRFSQADDAALVLFGRLYGTRVLYLSDLGSLGQSALLERCPGLRADIIIAGLPTAGEPLSRLMLERLQPRLIIVADSELPPTERARTDLRARLAQAGIQVIYTRLAGTTTLEMDRRGWHVQTMAGEAGNSR